MSLFPQLEPDFTEETRESSSRRPLAERMRPKSLDDFIGQEHLLAPGKPLRTQIERDDLHSMILWGPPGCGKTTLAQIIAKTTRSMFVPFSAVLGGIKEIKEVMAAAGRAAGHRTIVFVDEIHRFNKSQQDAFLPYVERGDIFLIGATTENPSFEIIGPLLSRTTVYVLKALDSAQVASLLQRALVDGDRGLADSHMEIPSELLGHIATISNGDVRAAYNILESLALGIAPNSHGHRPVKKEILEDVLQRRMLPYDKSGEEHFNLISALHKSVRNSDADATLYWLARMLESGEDPLYIARRLVRMASEDIGLAEPGALGICIAAMNAADLLGVPECNLALAQAAVYLSLAPKSNALYTGYGRVAEDLKHSSADPVPLHLRNAVTGLMANQGYGRGYQYAHNAEEKVTGMTCLPDSLADRKYYQPTDQGFEARLRQRMEEIRNIRSKKAGENPSSSKAAKK